MIGRWHVATIILFSSPRSAAEPLTCFNAIYQPDQQQTHRNNVAFYQYDVTHGAVET